MKVLVTGVNGQLGFDVVKELKKRGDEVVGLDRNELDITDEVAVRAFFENAKFDAFIHCAAYTAVDKAEEDRENCTKVNVDGTKFLAIEAQAQNAKFVYISTDYVFPGTGVEAYEPHDEKGPTNHYGVTKLQGEEVVKSIIKNYFIVRISWVFGENGNNFIKTMLNLAKTKDELSIIDDQVGSPTYTHDLAPLLCEMIKTDKYGEYNVSNEGFCSWYEFAEYIFDAANVTIKLNRVDSSAFVTKATRPKNSRMSKEALVNSGFQQLPSWQDATSRYIKVLMESK